MGQELLDMPGAHGVGMRLPPEVVDVAQNPLAVGLLRAIGVMVIAQHLAGLIQKFRLGIGPEFWFVFHPCRLNMGITGKTRNGTTAKACIHILPSIYSYGENLSRHMRIIWWTNSTYSTVMLSYRASWILRFWYWQYSFCLPF